MLAEFKNFTLHAAEQKILKLNYLNLIKSNLTGIYKYHISYPGIIIYIRFRSILLRSEFYLYVDRFLLRSELKSKFYLCTDRFSLRSENRRCPLRLLKLTALLTPIFDADFSL